MLKRTLFACILAAGAAHADTDTRPALIGLHECEDARIAHDQNVRLEFMVSETGTVSDAHVTKSSGNSRSDERLIQCVLRQTYKPATHNGVPVASPFYWEPHEAYLQELTGTPHAFAEMEHDIDHRCHKLYPVDRRFFIASNPISMVTVTRLESGEVQTAITQSAGEKADKNAIRCVQDILKDHQDLPAVFARTFTVDWFHHTVEGRK